MSTQMQEWATGPHPQLYIAPKVDVQFDYDNQAWIVNGRYQDCAHPPPADCECYGRTHKGNRAPNIH